MASEHGSLRGKPRLREYHCCVVDTRGMTIGPCALSAETVRRLNEKIAMGWKWHRLMALPPLLIIALLTPSMIADPSPVRIGLFLVPQVVIFLAALLLRPYRTISGIECSYVVNDDQLVSESRVDRQRKPDRAVVRWSEVVGVTDEANGIMLHLRSGDKLFIYNECLTVPNQRESVLALARRGQTT